MAKAKKKTRKKVISESKIERCASCEREFLNKEIQIFKPYEKVSRKGQGVCKLCARLMSKYNFAFIQEFVWFQNGRK